MDIVDTLVSARNFNALVATVKAADLIETLKEFMYKSLDRTSDEKRSKTTALGSSTR
jgi:hypothetical protein